MAEPFRYNRTMIALHWLTAALIATAWIGAQVIDFFPRDLRMPVRSTHILLGLILAATLLVRVAVRLTSPPVPPANAGLFERIAQLGHILLYILMAAVVLIGMGYAFVRGETLYGLVSLAAYAPADRSWRHLVGEWHELAANAILIVAGGHAAAALVHHYVLRDGLLRRMMPAA